MGKYNTEEEKNEAKKLAWRKWYESHKEQVKIRHKNYNSLHKEEKRDYNKKYREEHKDYYQDYNKKWHSEHRDERLEKHKIWLYDNKKHVDEYYHDRKNTKEGRAMMLYHCYLRQDKKRGFDTSNNVTPEWIIENIFTSKCIYCGDSDWQHLGCDRIDNTKPHTPDNVVCSCGVCNIERTDRYSVEEFIEYRKQHPRACDTKKEPSINDKGLLMKKKI